MCCVLNRNFANNSTKFKNLVIVQSGFSKSKNDLARANRWRREKASSDPLVPLSVGLSSNLLNRFDIVKLEQQEFK